MTMKFHTARHPQASIPSPIVLGHLVPWYTILGNDFPLHPDDSATLDWQPAIEDMRHWNDSRSGYRRTHLDLPEIGVYDSRNPEVIRWQFETALQYGVSGFIINWYGKYSVENIITLHWLRELDRWNATHPDRPIAYVISYDMQAQWPSEGKRTVSMDEDFAYIRDHLMRDTYLHRDGRPIFLVFPYGDEREMFRKLLDRTFDRTGADLIWSGAPRGVGENGCFAWIKPDAESVDPEFPDNWTDPDNCGELELRRFYKEANRSDPSCDYIMHGVWPGFNSELVAWAWSSDPSNPRIRPRVMCRETRDGSTIERTWQVYLDYLRRHVDGDPKARVPAPMVQLVTWNDYAETTSLEPSREHGRLPLEQCRMFIETARKITGAGS